MQLAWYSINVEGMGLKWMSQKGARLLMFVGNEYLCIHQCPLSTSHQLCLLEDCSLVQLCGHSWFVKLKSLIIIRTIIDCFKSHEGLQGMELFITAQNQKFLLWFWLTTIEWWRTATTTAVASLYALGTSDCKHQSSHYDTLFNNKIPVRALDEEYNNVTLDRKLL